MGKVNRELLDKLTDFMVTELESRAMDGITYVMVMADEKEKIKKYSEIKEAAKQAGFGENELFRVYKVNNGFIYDMDLSVVKVLTINLTKKVAQDRQLDIQEDLIGEAPAKRRIEDMQSLAKYCKNQYEKGTTTFEVALFSRNSVGRIVINGTDSRTKAPVVLQYNAYAIRHWDIEEINRQLLAPAGLRIVKIEPCEILSSKTGVRFKINIARA